MGKTFKIFNNIDELSYSFAQQIIANIQKKNEGHYFSLALSGGSTPKAVFIYLASNFKDTISWNKILIFWGDERCVEPENDESNYKMAKENLLDHIPIPEKNIFRITGENEPIKESVRYFETVKKYVPVIDEVPQFDLIMLGLGDDGHTASIFPNNPVLYKSNKLFEATENPYTKQKRITATFKLINHASNVVFFVTGKSKSEMISRILERKKGWEELPASMVRPVDGELIWLLDEGAAMELKRDNH